MSAARHEVDVTDLVHAAQVRVIDFQFYDDPIRIEFEPALIVECHLGHHKIARETFRSHHSPLRALERLATDEQLTAGEQDLALRYWRDYWQAGGDPAGRLAAWRDRFAELSGARPLLAGSGSTWFIEGTPAELGIEGQAFLRVGAAKGALVAVRTVREDYSPPDHTR